MPARALIKPVLALLGIVGTAFMVDKHLSKKKVFIGFAMEDQSARNFLVAQSHNGVVPFEFRDRSVKEPWTNAWKTKCRKRIKNSDAVIVIISKNTMQAKGVRWEIKCALEEKKHFIAIYKSKKDKGCQLPPELGRRRPREWTWDTIKKFINGLDKK